MKPDPTTTSLGDEDSFEEDLLTMGKRNVAIHWERTASMEAVRERSHTASSLGFDRSEVIDPLAPTQVAAPSAVVTPDLAPTVAIKQFEHVVLERLHRDYVDMATEHAPELSEVAFETFARSVSRQCAHVTRTRGPEHLRASIRLIEGIPVVVVEPELE